MQGCGGVLLQFHKRSGDYSLLRFLSTLPAPVYWQNLLLDAAFDVTERARHVTGRSSSWYVQVRISFGDERVRPEAARAVSFF